MRPILLPWGRRQLCARRWLQMVPSRSVLDTVRLLDRLAISRGLRRRLGPPHHGKRRSAVRGRRLGSGPFRGQVRLRQTGRLRPGAVSSAEPYIAARDTNLGKVCIGTACHTGRRLCFPLYRIPQAIPATSSLLFRPRNNLVGGEQPKSWPRYSDLPIRQA
jgi:hypothetical protein